MRARALFDRRDLPPGCTGFGDCDCETCFPAEKVYPLAESTELGGDGLNGAAVVEELQAALTVTLGPLEHLVAIIEGRDERARLVTPHGTSSAGARAALDIVRAALTAATALQPSHQEVGSSVVQPGERE